MTPAPTRPVGVPRKRALWWYVFVRMLVVTVVVGALVLVVELLFDPPPELWLYIPLALAGLFAFGEKIMGEVIHYKTLSPLTPPGCHGPMRYSYMQNNFICPCGEKLYYRDALALGIIGTFLRVQWRKYLLAEMTRERP